MLGPLAGPSSRWASGGCHERTDRTQDPGTDLPALSALHPLRTLREILSWDPFQEMAPLLPLEIQKVIPPFEVR
jgi:hypothetical protein